MQRCHTYRAYLVSWFIFLSIPWIGYAKETVCLNMIVRDEKHVIQRALDSVKDVIDYWVIVDTGSTDGTQDVIREHLKGIPGELFERPWQNFGHNRMEALELAKGKGDYVLFLDADDTWEFEKERKIPPLTAGVYHIWWKFTDGGEFAYLKPGLVKSSLPWKWVGIMHEGLICDAAYTEDTLDHITYKCTHDGARSSDPEKFKKAAAILEEGLRQEPENARYMFYLAESYRDAGELEKAIKVYEKRVLMQGWEEEVFWSLLQIAELKEKEHASLEDVISAYYTAHRYRPHRVEPVYALGEIYNRLGKYALAYECMKGWEALPKPKKPDRLFNKMWMEEYGIAFQLSICSYYVGQYEESLALCNQLLKREKMPLPWKEQTEKNRKFPEEKIKRLFSNA